MRMLDKWAVSNPEPQPSIPCTGQGFPARILETRKTAPGMRVLDKWAVLAGWGTNHRIGLHDMVMIKNNHIAAAGGVQAAIRCCQVWREPVLASLPCWTTPPAQLLSAGGVDHSTRFVFGALSTCGTPHLRGLPSLLPCQNVPLGTGGGMCCQDSGSGLHWHGQYDP